MSDALKERKEKLFYDHKNGYDRLTAADEAAMADYCRGYMAFLQQGKTERLCVAQVVAMAQAAGFKPFTRGMSLAAGDKVYTVNRGKSVMLAVRGREALREGCQITASHIDSPRLDVKPSPLYEDSELAYFKTHYYGGIRKYQWVAIPLAIYGVVALKDGTVREVALGEGDEPKFVVTDLLPHLGGEQGKKPLNEAIPAENLNILLEFISLKVVRFDFVPSYILQDFIVKRQNRCVWFEFGNILNKAFVRFICSIVGVLMVMAAMVIVVIATISFALGASQLCTTDWTCQKFSQVQIWVNLLT